MANVSSWQMHWNVHFYPGVGITPFSQRTAACAGGNGKVLAWIQFDNTYRKMQGVFFFFFFSLYVYIFKFFSFWSFCFLWIEVLPKQNLVTGRSALQRCWVLWLWSKNALKPVLNSEDIISLANLSGAVDMLQVKHVTESTAARTLSPL